MASIETVVLTEDKIARVFFGKDGLADEACFELLELIRTELNRRWRVISWPKLGDMYETFEGSQETRYLRMAKQEKASRLGIRTEGLFFYSPQWIGGSERVLSRAWGLTKPSKQKKREPQWAIVEITVTRDKEDMSFHAYTATAKTVAQTIGIPPDLMLERLIHRFEEEVKDLEFHLNAAKALVELVAPIKSGLRKVKG